jgi:hypothetical protein
MSLRPDLGFPLGGSLRVAELFERMAARRRRRGKSRPFGDQEPVSCDAQHRVVVEAAPSTSFVVAEAEFLLEVLVVAFDAPAQLGQVD